MIVTIHEVQIFAPIILIAFAGIAGGGLGYLIGLRDRAPYGKGTIGHFLLAAFASPFALAVAIVLIDLVAHLGWL